MKLSTESETNCNQTLYSNVTLLMIIYSEGHIKLSVKISLPFDAAGAFIDRENLDTIAYTRFTDLLRNTESVQADYDSNPRKTNSNCSGVTEKVEM